MKPKKNDTKSPDSELFLRACTQALAAKKSRNQSWLAKGAGIASKTLSRFLARETIAMDKRNMLSLARFLLTDTVNGCLGSQEKTDLKAYLSQHEDVPDIDQGELSPKIERYLLENQDMAILVYLLCCNSAGLSARDLFSLGDQARFYLEKLLKNKWVIERDQRYHAIDKNFVIKKGMLLQRAASVFLQRMNPERWDKQVNVHNYFYFYTESLKPEAMKKVTDILLDASKKIEQVIQDKQQHGDLPCSILLFQDLLKKI